MKEKNLGQTAGQEAEVVSFREEREKRGTKSREPLPPGSTAKVVNAPYTEHLEKYLEGLRLTIKREWERRSSAGEKYDEFKKQAAELFIAHLPTAEDLHEKILDLSPNNCREDPYQCEALLDAFEEKRKEPKL